MDELEISGKRYISTRRAGKEHQYHADYIGQLIRGGKVKGQKVGRSWYVDESSLAVYLGKEIGNKGHRAEMADEAAPVSAPQTEPEAVPEEEAVEKEKETQPEEAQVELEVLEKHERVTPWRKIPEVARSEPFASEAIKKMEAAEQQEEAAQMREAEKEVLSEFFPDTDEPAASASFAESIPEDSSESMEASVHRIAIRNPLKEEKKKNITYVAHDAPVFPAKVRKNKISLPVAASAAEEENPEDGQDISVVVIPRAQRRAVRPLQFASVAMLGVLAFIIVGGMSYLLSYKTTVEGDQMSASITLK